MSQLFRHLPWFCVLGLTFYLGAINLSMGAGFNILITGLAPVLWLGLYWLGSDHPAEADKAG